MKKHNIITGIIIFILTTGFPLASNLIRWDETPLEQTVYAVPLVAGFLLEIPVMAITLPVFSLFNFMTNETSFNTGYHRSIIYIVPFITGLFCTAIYFLILLLVKKIQDNKITTSKL